MLCGRAAGLWATRSLRSAGAHIGPPLPEPVTPSNGGREPGRPPRLLWDIVYSGYSPVPARSPPPDDTHLPLAWGWQQPPCSQNTGSPHSYVPFQRAPREQGESAAQPSSASPCLLTDWHFFPPLQTWAWSTGTGRGPKRVMSFRAELPPGQIPKPRSQSSHGWKFSQLANPRQPWGLRPHGGGQVVALLLLGCGRRQGSEPSGLTAASCQ